MFFTRRPSANVRDHPVHVSVSTGAGLWRRGKTVGTDIDSDAI